MAIGIQLSNRRQISKLRLQIQKLNTDIKRIDKHDTHQKEEINTLRTMLYATMSMKHDVTKMKETMEKLNLWPKEKTNGK